MPPRLCQTPGRLKPKSNALASDLKTFLDPSAPPLYGSGLNYHQEARGPFRIKNQRSECISEGEEVKAVEKFLPPQITRCSAIFGFGIHRAENDRLLGEQPRSWLSLCCPAAASIVSELEDSQ